MGELALGLPAGQGGCDLLVRVAPDLLASLHVRLLHEPE